MSRCSLTTNQWRVGLNENKEVSFCKKSSTFELSVNTGMHKKKKIHSVRAKNADCTCTHSTSNKIHRWAL